MTLSETRFHQQDHLQIQTSEITSVEIPTKTQDEEDLERFICLRDSFEKLYNKPYYALNKIIEETKERILKESA